MPIIKKHQTVLDFVTQYGGSVEGWFEMAQANSISVTDEPAPGTVLQTPVIDEQAIKVFAAGEIDITSIRNPNQYIRLGGIGYMQIGNDFIVS